MPILVHFKAKNNDNSYFYKNSGLSFPWVPYYVKARKDKQWASCGCSLADSMTILGVSQGVPSVAGDF